MRAACSAFLFKSSPTCLMSLATSYLSSVGGCSGVALERAQRPSPCRCAPSGEGRAASAPLACCRATPRSGASPSARAWRKAGCSAVAGKCDAMSSAGAAAMTIASNVVDWPRAASPHAGSQHETRCRVQMWVDSGCLEMEEKVYLKLWVKLGCATLFTQIVPKWHFGGGGGAVGARSTPAPTIYWRTSIMTFSAIAQPIFSRGTVVSKMAVFCCNGKKKEDVISTVYTILRCHDLM